MLVLLNKQQRIDTEKKERMEESCQKGPDAVASFVVDFVSQIIHCDLVSHLSQPIISN